MTPLIGFATFLGLTVVLLACVTATGLLAKRKIHLVLVAMTLVSLVAAIIFAERLGRLYDLEAAGAIKPIHLFLAKFTTLAYLLPIITGLKTIKNPTWRPWHRRCAFLILALTVVTAVTGVWMIAAADPLPA